MEAQIVRGDVVQIIDEKHRWFPCLVVVSEVHPWGVMGYVTIPNNGDEPCGDAYIRLGEGEYDFVGSAVIVRRD